MQLREELAGRYRLGRSLGRGGMGTVYAAHDEVLGREVAVKVLDIAHAPAESTERFRREAQLLARLAHPNVVTVFDFGTDDTHAWLVMQLLPGPTMQGLIEQRGQLGVAATIDYGRQVASALAVAHAAGIVHRDVKPANLMLDADGVCQVLDLGIARLADTVAAQPALTQAGMIMGTPPYLAPEIITGGEAGPPADVYALGAVLFRMLTGRVPYAGPDAMATLGMHVNAPIPLPGAERPEIGSGLAALVPAMLAKDPAERPPAEAVARSMAALPAGSDARTDAAGSDPAHAGAAGTDRAHETQLIAVRARRAGPSRATLLVVLAVLILAAAGLITGALLAGPGTSATAGPSRPVSAAPPATARPSSPTAQSPTRSAPTSATPSAAKPAKAAKSAKSAESKPPKSSTSAAPPPARPAPAPALRGVAAALDTLRATVDSATRSAGLPDKAGGRLQRRVDILVRSVGTGNVDVVGKQITAFRRDLAGLRRHSRLDRSTYLRLLIELGQVRRLA